MMRTILVTAFILTLSFLSYGQETAAVTAAETAVEKTAEISTEKVTEVTKLAENQIPLSIAADKKTTETGSAATKAMVSGLIVIALLGTSYYYIRKYKVSNTINKSNMKIKVLTQHYLGPKKSLAIIHVAGESILVGITDTNISMIKSLSLIDDEVPTDMPKTFGESMAKKSAQNETMIDELDEEFSFAGVTDTVSKKIKSMRSFS